MSTELKDVICRSCRSQLGLDDSDEANGRLQALFVISITLGLRPGELRTLTWDHVDLDRGVIHVWRSASRSGDTKTPASKRSLELPKRAIVALTAHRATQAKERLAAGDAWHDNNLAFCHENGDQYTSDQLNWRFSKMTRRAGPLAAVEVTDIRLDDLPLVLPVQAGGFAGVRSISAAAAWAKPASSSLRDYPSASA